MDKEFVFVDAVHITKKETPVHKKQVWELSSEDGESKGQKKRALAVKYAATHAGIPLKSSRSFYLPTEMRRGVKTMTNPYKIPLLKNHNIDEDPIGRVVSAQFVNTAGAFLNKHPEFSALMEDSTSKERLRLLVNRLALQIGEDKDFKGLGYIQATVNVLDKEEQDKFLDERHLTPSVSMTAGDVMCSCCGSLLSEGTDGLFGMEFACGHGPGDTDEETGAPWMKIPLDFTYREISTVTIPRDKHAIVKNIEISDSEIEMVSVVKDSDQTKFYNLGVDFKDAEIPVSTLKRNLKPFLEDETMPKPKNTEVVSDPIADKENQTPEENPETEAAITNDAETVTETTTEVVPFEDFYTTLTDEQEVKTLFGVEDSDVFFAGKGKTFPANTLAQAQRSLEIAQKYTDESEVKNLIIQTLNDRIAELQPVTEETTSDPTAETVIVELTDDDYKNLLKDAIAFLIEKKFADSETEVIKKLAIFHNLIDNKVVKSKDLMIDTLKAQLEVAKVTTLNLLKKFEEKPATTPAPTETTHVVKDAVRVENPVGTVIPKDLLDKETSNEGDASATSKDTEVDMYKTYRETYYRKQNLQGPKAAQKYLDSLKFRGWVPSELNFD